MLRVISEYPKVLGDNRINREKMESIIEVMRILHEERDRLMEEMVEELSYKKKNYKDEINSGHRFKEQLNRYARATKKLLELYEDKDGLKKDEVLSITSQNEFAQFYGRLRNIKEFHRKYPDSVDTFTLEFEKYKQLRERHGDTDEMMVQFSDEEGFGKFLDLHSIFYLFTNMDSIRTNTCYSKLSYLDYLAVADRLYDIPFEVKSSSEYLEYITTLKDYLRNFIERSKPLVDVEGELMDSLKQFDGQWSCGDFPGWPENLLNSISQSSSSSALKKYINLEEYETPDQIEQLGMDKLKKILQSLGLKCGGSLSDRAKRLFVLKTRSIDELDSSFFPKTDAKGLSKNKPFSCPKLKSMEDFKSLSFQEAHVYHFFDILREELEATRDNVERKQARTAEELAQEDEDDVVELQNVIPERDYEETMLYNPKNLPLDFDGRPIPYWLYKLHGLNIYYNCEICGNAKYRGPKAFQRHFGEWRHAHGMRCLGIPNTAHFVNVTKIQDAYNLWDVIKNTKVKEQWNPELDEEFEDTSGNPINKKIYEDLRKQGLL